MKVPSPCNGRAMSSIWGGLPEDHEDYDWDDYEDEAMVILGEDYMDENDCSFILID